MSILAHEPHLEEGVGGTGRSWKVSEITQEECELKIDILGLEFKSLLSMYLPVISLPGMAETCEHKPHFLVRPACPRHGRRDTVLSSKLCATRPNSQLLKPCSPYL